MKQLLTVPIVGGISKISCPGGMQIRAVAFGAAVAAITDGDAPTIRFSRGTDQLIEFSGNAQALSVVLISGGIGMSSSESYTAAASTSPPASCSMSLPDVWWQYDVNVVVGCGSGVVDTGFILYELKPLE